MFFYSKETPQNEHPESSGRAVISPGPPGESGVVATPHDERISSQVNGLNSETPHSEIDLPEDRRQPNPFLNDAPTLMTENASPRVGEEAGVTHFPEERTSRDASNGILRGIPSSKVQDRDFSQTLATGPTSATLLPPVPYENTTSTSSSTYASHPIIPNTTARTYPLASDGFKFKGVPLSKGLQKELDQDQSSSPTTENFSDERRNLEPVRSDVATAGHGSEAVAANDTTTTTGPSSSSHHAEHETLTPHRKKPGFMNKLKEEVKGISGRLTHKKGER